MKIHHNILTYTSPLQDVIRKISVSAGVASPNRLRVLNFHDIPPSEEAAFARQLNWLKKNWKINSPKEFEKLISGDIPIKGDNLMITFDDGFFSNRIIAEKFLNPLGIQALFFVVSDFVGIDDHEKASRFIVKNIYPELEIYDIPNQWRNMQWNDLKVLIDQGHTIGCHTKKHTRLSNCRSEEELETEIIESADLITKNLGIKVDHFSYTFGDINSFSKNALAVAKRRFRYIYSGLRGDNVKGGSPFQIRRDAASYQGSDHEYVIFKNDLLNSFLGGFTDLRYRNSLKILDRWDDET
jgi:peptidoglycan/xylan/chitin deacetylase (PgdA/CDA1 family)